MLERFLKGDPKYVSRFLEIWQAAPGGTHRRIRWTYPITWSIPGVGNMRFRGVANPANERDGLTFNEWIPLDADTWVALERLAGD